MNYIIFDMEWNQPFPKKKILQIPIKLYGEIIQIAAVKVDEDLAQIDSFNEIVKPVYYTKMDREVSELTEITEAEIEEGRPFADVITEFREWMGDDGILMTWGPEDMRMLEDNLIVHDMDYDWLPEEVDAQMLFDDLVTQEDRNFALSHAMYIMDIKPLRCHDALNDCMNTVEVLRKMDMAEDIKSYVMEWFEEDTAE